jgi:hypothetical protein
MKLDPTVLLDRGLLNRDHLPLHLGESRTAAEFNAMHASGGAVLTYGN